MRTRLLFASLLAGLLVVAPCALRAAGTEMLDLDPLLAAKVAKEKAKAGAAGAEKGSVRSADKAVVSGRDECGVNIGNIDSGKAGKGSVGPRDNTVVITGPVINLGKCK